ncbi:MAG: hypothetical protein OHK0039_44180 [Bacteroidia bacterium]
MYGVVPAQTFQLTYIEDENGQGGYADAHKVQPAETLYGIARMYNLTVEELKALNQLSDNTIHPGQRLIVKPMVPAQAAMRTQEVPPVQPLVAETESEPFPPAGQPSYAERRLQDYEPLDAGTVERRRYYEVKAGDNIYTVAARFGVLVDQLQEWNALIELQPGQTIIVGKDEPALVQAPAEEPQQARALGQTVYEPAAWSARTAPANDPVLAAEEDTYTQVGDIRSLGQPTDMPRSEPQPQQARTAPQPQQPQPQYHEPVRAAPVQQPVQQRVRPSQADVLAHPAVYLDVRDEAKYALLGSRWESGPYAQIERGDRGDQRFYAAHKTLPIGSRVKVDIPGNAGFLEVEVVARLTATSQALIGLSPAATRILQQAGAPAQVTIIY